MTEAEIKTLNADASELMAFLEERRRAHPGRQVMVFVVDAWRAELSPDDA